MLLISKMICTAVALLCLSADRSQICQAGPNCGRFNAVWYRTEASL